MTTLVHNRPLVRAPGRSQVRYGLFSQVDFSNTGPHWQLGVDFESDGCGPLLGIGDPSCVPAGGTGTDGVLGLPKDFGDGPTGPELSTASPFTVYGTYQCTAGANDAQAFANRRLEAGEEWRVEQALWTGDLGNTPNLPAGADSLGSGLSLSAGIGLLEQYAAERYGRGVIHLTRWATLEGLAQGLLEKNDDGLVTVLGTPVVAGTGYQDNSDGTSVGYVTSEMLGFRSEIFTSSNRLGDLLDRGTNWMRAIAERTYLIGWDPCGVGKVEISLEEA